MPIRLIKEAAAPLKHGVQAAGNGTTLYGWSALVVEKRLADLKLNMALPIVLTVEKFFFPKQSAISNQV